MVFIHNIYARKGSIPLLRFIVAAVDIKGIIIIFPLYHHNVQRTLSRILTLAWDTNPRHMGHLDITARINQQIESNLDYLNRYLVIKKNHSYFILFIGHSEPVCEV